MALAGGLIYGFSFVHPFHLEAKQLSKLLLQASVVGLGFGMDLQQVMQAGRSGFIYTAGSISIALLLGWGLGRLLHVCLLYTSHALDRGRGCRRRKRDSLRPHFSGAGNIADCGSGGFDFSLVAHHSGSLLHGSLWAPG